MSQFTVNNTVPELQGNHQKAKIEGLPVDKISSTSLDFEAAITDIPMEDRILDTVVAIADLPYTKDDLHIDEETGRRLVIYYAKSRPVSL